MSEYMTLSEAGKYLGVSRFKVWTLVKEGKLVTYETDANARVKLVKQSDLDILKQPRQKRDKE